MNSRAVCARSVVLFVKGLSVKPFVVVGLFLVFASSLLAQAPPEMPKPSKEHEWLKQFVGEWEMESECTPVPGQPPVKGKMSEKVRSIGGFWVLSEGKAEMMGQKFETVMTVGWSPEKKKYVGTWTDSMMPHLWQYEGTVDATGKILTLEATGPSMTKPGTMTVYRDVNEFRSPDERVFSSYVQDEKGEWIRIATGVAKRKK